MAETTGDRNMGFGAGGSTPRRSPRATKAVDGWRALSRRKLPAVRADAVDLILTEREVQERLFTVAHDRSQVPIEWAALMTKYVGRLAENAKEKRFAVYRRNLVVIAAVCLSALEVEPEDDDIYRGPATVA